MIAQPRPLAPSGSAPQALRRYLVVAAILLSGLLLKAALMDTESTSFDSDEAIVALMARHILAGERPLFFYGQAYMGSLDAFLTAASFWLFGSSVWALRAVQGLLFVGLMLGTYCLARRLYKDECTAQTSALLIAIPPSLFSLYTTVTLGGYGETLLCGIWLLILGQQITHEAQTSWLHWAVFGLVAGLSLWILPLSVVYLLPLLLLIVRKWRWQLGGRYGAAVVTFLLGSSPWWGYCLGHGEACLQPFLKPAASQVVSAGWLPALGYRAFSFLFLGIPTLWGLRYPWSSDVFLSLVAAPAIVLYLGSVVHALYNRDEGRILVLAVMGTFLLVFLGTSFGNDSTGRYLLPLYPCFALLGARSIGQLRQHKRWLAAAALVSVLAFSLGRTVAGAATEPAGMTAQLDGRLQFGNGYDAALISFLRERDERVGYSNYWVAFKIDFLANEEIVIAPRLPYKADLSYSSTDDRYPAYSRKVDQSAMPPFYITSNQPRLDERLRGALDVQHIGYQEQVIGPYLVFYDLSVHVSPEGLELYGQP